MKLERKHKIYIGVLVAAGAAVLIDALFLRPDDASAARPESSDDAATVDSSQTSVSHSPATGAMSRVAASLEEIRSSLASNDRQDAFDPDIGWRAVAAQRNQADAGPIVADPSERFRTTYTLTSVLLSDQNGGAVVNGRFVRVGDTVAGFTLMGVENRSATFSDGVYTVVLRIERDRSR